MISDQDMFMYGYGDQAVGRGDIREHDQVSRCGRADTPGGLKTLGFSQITRCARLYFAYAGFGIIKRGFIDNSAMIGRRAHDYFPVIERIGSESVVDQMATGSYSPSPGETRRRMRPRGPTITNPVTSGNQSDYRSQK